MLCKTCKTLVDNLRQPEVALKHHEWFCDLETSMEEHCSWCVKLWEKCLKMGAARYARCDFQAILSLSQDRYIISFWAGGSAYTEFVRKYEKPFTLLLIPHKEIGRKAKQRLSNNTFSRESHNCAVRWVTTCLREHELCYNNRENRVMPGRLIQIGPSGADLFPRVVETAELPRSIQYIALSHSWGREKFFCLTKSNIDELKQRIPFHELSKVFQDSIVVVRRLGLRYIWIDSLCIIQDQLEDWQTESRKMGDLYQNSFCNIAATGFPDGRRGLFMDRDPVGLYTERIRIREEIIWQDGKRMPRGQYVSLDFHLWEDGVTEAPLNRRAWVVQERLLSPRTLHFGKNQLLWECYENESCELFPDGLPHEVTTMKVKQNSALKSSLMGHFPMTSDEKSSLLYELWSDVISVYTKGSLSHDKDKLVAISGLASKFQSLFQGGEYVVGMWKQNLLPQLLWETRFGGINGVAFSQRPKVYRAPSWSWASIDSEIIPGRPGSCEEKHCYTFTEVLEVKVIAVDNNPLGQIKSADLRLRGPLVCATLVTEGEENCVPPVINWTEYLFVLLGGREEHQVLIAVYADITRAFDSSRTLDSKETSRSTTPCQLSWTLGPEIMVARTGKITFLPIQAMVTELGAYFELQGLILEQKMEEKSEQAGKVFKRIGKFEVVDPAECVKFLSAIPVLPLITFGDFVPPPCFKRVIFTII